MVCPRIAVTEVLLLPLQNKNACWNRSCHWSVSRARLWAERLLQLRLVSYSSFSVVAFTMHKVVDLVCDCCSSSLVIIVDGFVQCK